MTRRAPRAYSSGSNSDQMSSRPGPTPVDLLRARASVSSTVSASSAHRLRVPAEQPERTRVGEHDVRPLRDRPRSLDRAAEGARAASVASMSSSARPSSRSTLAALSVAQAARRGRDASSATAASRRPVCERRCLPPAAASRRRTGRCSGIVCTRCAAACSGGAPASSSISAARRCARARSAALMPSRTALRTTGWVNSSGFSCLQQVGA